MPQKNWLKCYQIITAGVMTGTNVLTSAVTDISFLDNVCMELVWTGNPVGTFEVQGSITGNTWKTITFTPNNPAGTASNSLFDLNQLSFPKIRLLYTNSAGVGVLNVYIGGKSI